MGKNPAGIDGVWFAVSLAVCAATCLLAGFGAPTIAPVAFLAAGFFRRGLLFPSAALAAYALAALFSPPSASLNNFLLLAASLASFFVCFRIASTPAARHSPSLIVAGAAAAPALVGVGLVLFNSGPFLSSVQSISPAGLLLACAVLLAAAAAAAVLAK